jgi:hypothetical protein
VQQGASDSLVPFDEHVGFYVDWLAENAFDRRAPTIDGRTHFFDDCPAASVLWQIHVAIGGKGEWSKSEQVLCRARRAREPTAQTAFFRSLPLVGAGPLATVRRTQLLQRPPKSWGISLRSRIDGFETLLA